MNARPIPESEAQNFWDQSETAPLFCDPSLLKLLKIDATHYGAYKAEELTIVWPVVPGEKLSSVTPPFSYYFGPYMKNPLALMRPFRAYRTFLDGINSLLNVLTDDFSHLELSLAPEFADFRPFLWWNYARPGERQFVCKPRYSARIFPTAFEREEDVLLAFRSDKRQRIRSAIKRGRIEARKDADFSNHELVSIYKRTLERSGGELFKQELETLSTFLSMKDAVSVGGTRFEVIRGVDRETGSLLGFQLLLLGKHQCYVVAQGVTDLGRQLEVSPFLTHESVLLARSYSLSIFDFNGANSPNRADDKHAFGASSVNYADFELH